MKKEQTYEAFSLDNTKLNVYSDMNTNLQTNIDFINCIDNNNKDCEKIKSHIEEENNQLIEKEKILNVSKDKRNKAQITYTECENKLRSCKHNYDEIMKKSKELNNIYETLQSNNKKLTENKKKITENKKKIENLKDEIEKMERHMKASERFNRFNIRGAGVIRKKIVKEMEKIDSKINSLEKEINSLEQTNIQINNKNINVQKLFYNLNSSISSLEDLYRINKCETTKDCYSELNENEKVKSDLKKLENEYKILQNKLKEIENQHKICIDPRKNKCKNGLNKYEDKYMDINNNLYYMKSELEQFTNLEENIKLNNELKEIQKENKINRNNFRLFQNPSTDSSSLLENEICKNIVITTIGSVMLYYFFFEFE